MLASTFALGASAAGADTAPAGQLQVAAPITSFPPEPRTTDGTDPFASVTAPNECSPARDTGRGDNYTPLRRLKQQPRLDNPFVRGESTTVAVELVNRKGQRFRIYISAMTQAPIDAFLQSSSACLERVPVTRRIPSIIEPVRLDVILVGSAVLATGLTQAQLAAVRDALALAGPVTLELVLSERGADPEAVAVDAATRADAELQAKIAAGELTADEVAAFDTHGAMLALLEELGAPFLFNPAELTMSPGALGTRLKRDPRRALVIGMESIGPIKRTEMVWFAFDPLINAGAIHAYRARCQRVSSVSITRWAGSVTLAFWRVTTPNPIGTRTANSDNPSPPGMSHSSWPTYRTYDDNVKGNQDKSDYSVYGGWVQGTGGGC